MTELTHRTFDTYIEPLVESLMLGEVRSIRYSVEMDYSADMDWVAKTRFRNTDTISVYNGKAHTMDILNLCRICKMWLVTEEIFDIMCLYYWANPVYRSQFLGITGTEADYESMILTADKHTQRFIPRVRTDLSPIQHVALSLIKYQTAIITNRGIKSVNPYEEFNKIYSAYKIYMEEHHHGAYITARRYKAQQWLVDNDGFIILEQTKSDAEMLNWH